MRLEDRNRAWLRKIEKKLLTLPEGQRAGSVIVTFVDGGTAALIRHLDWHSRDTSVDQDEEDLLAS